MNALKLLQQFQLKNLYKNYMIHCVYDAQIQWKWFNIFITTKLKNYQMEQLTIEQWTGSIVTNIHQLRLSRLIHIHFHLLIISTCIDFLIANFNIMNFA